MTTTSTTLATALLGASLAAAMTTATASANQINTGGATGAYHSTFCPQLSRRLGVGSNYRCVTSQGTRENIHRVFSDPRQIGYGQLDVLALETADVKPSPFKILRNDDVKECVFAVTRSRQIGSYGDIAGYASELNFVLPPPQSGSAGTFQYLQQIDRDGLGLARAPVYANSTDDAIIRALNSDDVVTFFVQFPDPSNERFKLIKRLGGQLVPVLDRNILNREVDGRKIYTLEETDLVNPSWSETKGKVTTACTPMVVFTGDSARITDDRDARAHQDMIAKATALSAASLRPRGGFFSRLIKRSTFLSESARERLLNLSAKAREKAAPYIERAKERAKELRDTAAERAQPRKDRW